jgi:hypothetical protein
MSVLTITVNTPAPAFFSQASEVAYLLGLLQTVEKEIGRGNGTVTSGSIIGTNAAGTPNSSLGSWTYSPTASHP